jgi:hypothetical protein
MSAIYRKLAGLVLPYFPFPSNLHSDTTKPSEASRGFHKLNSVVFKAGSPLKLESLHDQVGTNVQLVRDSADEQDDLSVVEEDINNVSRRRLPPSKRTLGGIQSEADLISTLQSLGGTLIDEITSLPRLLDSGFDCRFGPDGGKGIRVDAHMELIVAEEGLKVFGIEFKMPKTMDIDSAKVFIRLLKTHDMVVLVKSSQGPEHYSLSAKNASPEFS